MPQRLKKGAEKQKTKYRTPKKGGHGSNHKPKERRGKTGIPALGIRKSRAPCESVLTAKALE
jgi:hypothetical protein